MYKDLIEFLAQDNIAENLSDEKLKEIGSEVVEGYDVDRLDRSDWETKMKKAMDMALQNKKTKTFPWQNCSNIMMPVITEGIIQYNSRMYPALIPSSGLVKSRVIGYDPDGEKNNSAIRVSKYMDYEILEDDGWEEEMDRGFIVQPLLGNMYKKTYRDEHLNKNTSEMLSPNEFVCVNNAKSIEKSFRKTHFFDLIANELKSEQLQGNYLNVELGNPTKLNDEVDKESQRTSRIDDSTPYLILEQHTWFDLDEDGLMEPYIVTVEHKSRQVLRIVAGYNEEDITKEGEEVLNVRQEQYFTKYGFIPNPDGSIMDLGFGQLLGPINEQINNNINQLNDAGTLSNTGGGMIGRGVKIKGGKITRRMGQYTSVPTSGTDLARNVVHFPEVKPSPVLFNLLGMMMTAAQRLSSTLDSQVGENPGQNQKATTTMAVQQEGKRIFSGIYKRNHRALNKELKRYYYLNSIHLPASVYLNVIDGLSEEEKTQIGEEVFNKDFDLASVDIKPAADSKYTSEEEKMRKAQALIEMIPTGQVNPQVATKRALEAQEQPAIEEIMAMPEQAPPFEQIKLDREMSLEWAKLQLDVMSKENDWINNEILINSQAMKNLADAESAEAGIQYQEYSQQLEILREMSKTNIERMKQKQSELQQQSSQA